jgi:hypothetical protein
MIELICIFLSVLFLPIIFSYPLNMFNYNFIFSLVKLNFFDLILINVILHLFVLLFFSFFLSNFFGIFLADFSLSLILFFFYFKKYLIFFKKNFYIFLFYIILCFSIFASIAWYPILTWDGAVHWFYKALNYYQGETYKNLKNVPFNYYPHLGSFVWFYFWKNSFLQLEYFGRFFQAFLFITIFFSLLDSLSARFQIIEKIILILILTYFCKDNFLFGGYQEYLIFSIFYIFSRLFLLSNKCSNLTSKNILSILILLSSFLILWSKQEGFFYYLILNLIFLIHANNSVRFKFFYFTLSLLLILFFLFVKLYYFDSVNFNEPVLHKSLLNNFYPNIFFNKFALISKYLIISFIKYPIWITIIFSFIILYKEKYFKKNNFYLTYIFLIFLLFYLIYFQTNMDITFLLPLTISRLVFQSSGFLLPILIVSLNNLKSKKYSI